MLDTLSVELVTYVLVLLDHAELMGISHVSQRLRSIVCQYAMPCILRSNVLDDEKLCNIWLAHVQSILDLDSRITLVFNINGSWDPVIHSCRLRNWGYLLRTVSDLISSSSEDGHGRIVGLDVQLPQYYAEGLFSILSRRVVHLRDLNIRGCWDTSPDTYYTHNGGELSKVIITPDLFSGGAPALQNLSLEATIFPSYGIPSFASTTYFHCDAVSLIDLQRQLSLMPHLRSLSVKTVLMPFDIPDLKIWGNSQPPLPGGITNLAFRELSTNTVSEAQALAHVTTMATANARDVTIQAWAAWDHTPCAIAAFAVAAISPGASLFVLIERQQMNKEEEAETVDHDTDEDEDEDAEEEVDEERPLRFLVVGEVSMCGEGNARIVTVEVPWEAWGLPHKIVREFFERLPDSLHLTELRIAFSELKLVTPLQIISRATRAFGRVQLEVQEKESLRKEATRFGVCGDFNLTWSWASERDDMDPGTPPQAHSIHCSTPPGWVGVSLQVDIRFTEFERRTVDVQAVFVDTVLEASGFSRVCPVKIEIGAGLTMQQKSMRWDPVGKALRLVDSRFSEWKSTGAPRDRSTGT